MRTVNPSRPAAAEPYRTLMSSIGTCRPAVLISLDHDATSGNRRYRRFPLVASWSKLINTAGLQVPMLLISVLYGSAAAGLLGLTVRIVGGPAAVIGQAVYQVFSAEASAKVRGLDRELAEFTRR